MVVDADGGGYEAGALLLIAQDGGGCCGNDSTVGMRRSAGAGSGCDGWESPEKREALEPVGADDTRQAGRKGGETAAAPGSLKVSPLSTQRGSRRGGLRGSEKGPSCVAARCWLRHDDVRR